jgi:hypothetical protein
VVEHGVLGLLLAVKKNVIRIPHSSRSADRVPQEPIPSEKRDPIGYRGTKSPTNALDRRLPAEDVGEGADVEFLGIGALRAVNVHDVHGRVLRRRARGGRLLRFARHRCCRREEEEDRESVARLKEER